MSMCRTYIGELVTVIRKCNLAEQLHIERNILHNVKRNRYFHSTIAQGVAREKELQLNKCRKHQGRLRELKLGQIQKTDLQTKDRIPSLNDPDRFGNLCTEGQLRERLENLPEEDENVEEYLDGVEGKTRLKTVEYAKIIKNLLTEKKLLEALEVLEIRMKREKAKPDDYIYRLLISGCAKAGYTKKAFQLFNQMKKRALKVKGGTYTSLFDACANNPWPNDGIKRASGLWDLMVEKGVELNQQIAHAAIKAFGRCGDIEKAFGIADEMSSKGIPLTAETVSFLLQACASQKESGFRHALMVWRKMIEKKLVPTTYTYNLLLRCIRDCSIGDVNRFKEDLATFLSPSQLELIKLKATTELNGELASDLNIVESQVSNGEGNQDISSLVPTLLSQQPQIRGCEIHLAKIVKPWHRLMLAGGLEGFISMMLKTGAKPDIKTFTQLLFIIAPVEEQLLMDQMKKHGIVRDLDFCNMLIKKRNMNNNFAGAKEVLNIMREEQHVPNIVTFGVLALGCPNLRDMRKLLRDIKSLGYRVNIQILGSLLLSACRSWDFKGIHFIVNHLAKFEIKPNLMFVQHLENFNQDIKRNIEKKKSGTRYCDKLDSKSFDSEYEDFEHLVNYVKSLEIEDQIFVHPWNQFKRFDDSEEKEV